MKPGRSNMAWPGRSAELEKAVVGRICVGELTYEIGAHLVGALADRRPKDGHDLVAPGAQTLHCGDGALEHPVQRSTPARMGRADDVHVGIGEQDRAAIGRRDRQRQPGRRGRHAVGFRALARSRVPPR